MVGLSQEEKSARQPKKKNGPTSEQKTNFQKNSKTSDSLNISRANLKA
jgi:hypothetical protein